MTVVIRRALTQSSTGEVSLSKTKSGKSRTIAVEASLLRVLRQHERRQKFERWAAGANWEDHGLVFATSTGRPVKPGTLTSRFAYLAKKAEAEIGLRRITFHGLRHTNITISVKADVHAKVIADRAGHHSASYTMDTYAHLGVAGQRSAAVKIARILSGEQAAGTSSGEASAG